MADTRSRGTSKMQVDTQLAPKSIWQAGNQMVDFFGGTDSEVSLDHGRAPLPLAIWCGNRGWLTLCHGMNSKKKDVKGAGGYTV